MADQIVEQFRRYWLVATTIAGAAVIVGGVLLGIQGDMSSMRSDLRDLTTQVKLNLDSINQFRQATEASRYTSQDAIRDWARQSDINAEIRRRLDTLEQRRSIP